MDFTSKFIDFGYFLKNFSTIWSLSQVMADILKACKTSHVRMVEFKSLNLSVFCASFIQYA